MQNAVTVREISFLYLIIVLDSSNLQILCAFWTLTVAIDFEICQGVQYGTVMIIHSHHGVGYWAGSAPALTPRGGLVGC
jgi:hypothetical protein